MDTRKLWVQITPKGRFTLKETVYINLFSAFQCLNQECNPCQHKHTPPSDNSVCWQAGNDA